MLSKQAWDHKPYYVKPNAAPWGSCSDCGQNGVKQPAFMKTEEEVDAPLISAPVPDKESGERLSRLVEEACMLLADYSGRLAAEIDDRRQLTRTLTVFLQSQKDGLSQNEQKLEVRENLPTFLLWYYDCYVCQVSPASLFAVLSLTLPAERVFQDGSFVIFQIN